MSGYYALPGILYSIPRSPITALGLPFVFGLVSGSMTAKTVKGRWYEVGLRIYAARAACR